MSYKKATTLTIAVLALLQMTNACQCDQGKTTCFTTLPPSHGQATCVAQPTLLARPLCACRPYCPPPCCAPQYCRATLCAPQYCSATLCAQPLCAAEPYCAGSCCAAPLWTGLGSGLVRGYCIIPAFGGYGAGYSCGSGLGGLCSYYGKLFSQ